MEFRHGYFRSSKWGDLEMYGVSARYFGEKVGYIRDFLISWEDPFTSEWGMRRGRITYKFPVDSDVKWIDYIDAERERLKKLGNGDNGKRKRSGAEEAFKERFPGYTLENLRTKGVDFLGYFEKGVAGGDELVAQGAVVFPAYVEWKHPVIWMMYTKPREVLGKAFSEGEAAQRWIKRGLEGMATINCGIVRVWSDVFERGCREIEKMINEADKGDEKGDS